MATDVEKMTAILEANIRNFEKQMAKANATAQKQLSAIEAKAKATQNRVAVQLGRLGRGVAGLGLAGIAMEVGRQFLTAANEMVAIQNQLRTTGLEGEALTSTLDQLYQAAQRQGTALGPLAALYAGLARSQKELGVSSQQILGFSENVALALRVGGTSAEQASGALLQLSQALAGGTVRAEEFNSIVEGAPTILRAVAAGLQEAGGSVGKLRQLVNDGQVSSKAFFEAFQAGTPILQQMASTAQGTVGQALDRVGNALLMAAGEMDKAAGATQSLANYLNGLVPYIEAIPNALASASKYWSDFTSYVDAASAALLRFHGYDPQKVMEQAGIAPRTGYTTGGGFGGEPVPASPASSPRPVSLSQFPASAARPAGRARSGGGGGGATRDVTADAVRDIAARTRAVEMETRVLGLSTYERERLIAREEALADLRRADVAETPERLAQIEREADLYARAVEQRERMTEAQDRAREITQYFGQTITDALSSIIVDGQDATDVMRNLTRALANAALQAALMGQGPLAGLFGTGAANGGVGGLFGAAAGLFGRAAGGPVNAGRPYLVGERGPEVFLPRSSGAIAPMGRAGGGMSVQVIAAPGQTARTERTRGPDGAELVRVVMGEVEAGLAGGRFDRALGGRYGLGRLPRRAG